MFQDVTMIGRVCLACGAVYYEPTTDFEISELVNPTTGGNIIV